jgi:hypothetical protein
VFFRPQTYYLDKARRSEIIYKFDISLLSNNNINTNTKFGSSTKSSLKIFKLLDFLTGIVIDLTKITNYRKHFLAKTLLTIQIV